LLKAIESGANIDTELFRNQFTPAKTIKEKLLDRLTAACIVSAVGLAICIALLILAYNGGLASDLANFILISGGIILAVGISLFVVYFVGKRMLASEIETEEKTLSKKEK
jgi:high-affinity Fe2+/Pb2+ permease